MLSSTGHPVWIYGIKYRVEQLLESLNFNLPMEADLVQFRRGSGLGRSDGSRCRRLQDVSSDAKTGPDLGVQAATIRSNVLSCRKETEPNC